MDKQITIISEEETRGKAKDYFSNSCSLQCDEEEFPVMYRQGIEFRGRIISGIKILSIISGFTPEVCLGDAIKIDKIRIECPALKKIHEDNIIAIYLYMVTVKVDEKALQCRSLTDEFMADMWETSYLYAGMDSIKEIIEQDIKFNKKHKKYYLFDLGPGLYEMDMASNIAISKILEGQNIGVRVNDDGIMLPPKSCSGMVFALKEPFPVELDACKACIGDERSCCHCKMSFRR